MTEKEKYIKAAFKNYNDNKKRLQSISYESLHAIDYTKQRTKTSRATTGNKRLLNYIDLKQKLEKQIELVERVLWFYQLENLGKDEYIIQRYFKGKLLYRVAMDINLSESTLHNWERDIRETAARCADCFGLWY